MSCYPSVCMIKVSCYAIISEFTETPVMPENVTLNEDVVFRCRHSDAVAYAWYVNGSTLGNSPPEDITPSFDMLTIVALPRNNNTMIECVAFILTANGTTHSERAPPITLIIPGQPYMCSNSIVYTYMQDHILAVHVKLIIIMT